VAGELPVVGVIASAFGLELAGSTHDLGAEGAQLAGDGLIDEMPVRVKRSPSLWHGQHQRNAPAAQRADDELHRVDGLQPLHPAGRGNQPDRLVRQIGWITLREQDQPVEGVLNEPLTEPW